MQRLQSQDYITIPRKPPRDRYGRPLIFPAGYQPTGDSAIDFKERRWVFRVTKYIDVLDDTYQLDLWKQRQVLRGTVVRPDLQLKAAALGEQPDKIEAYDQYREWRDTYDKITRDLMAAAKSGEKANIGDALHLFTERLDRGLKVNPSEVPQRYHQHLTNYVRATEKLTAMHIERFMVCDELKAGGTPDRILIDERGRIVIGDVKTGNTDYDPEKIARQLAIYAHSQFYDDATGQRFMPIEIDQQWGIVIKLDARTGICELLDINLAEGWEGVLACQRIRAERNRKVTVQPHVDPNAPVLPSREEVTPETMAAIKTAIGAAPTKEALDQIFYAAAHLWTDELTERGKERLGELTLKAAGPNLTLVGA